MQTIILVSLIVAFVFLGILFIAILLIRDAVESIKNEQFMINDAIDKLYEEVFPDNY